MTLKRIEGTSRAPYRLRFLTSDFPAPGSIVVEWRYRFSTDSYEANGARRLMDGRIEHHVHVAGHSIPAADWTDELASSLAEEIVAEARVA